MNSPVILVTGAGKGIGHAVVQGLIQRKTQFHHPRLLLTSRTSSDLENLQSLAHSNGLKCEILPLELSSDPTLPIQKAITLWGRLDSVIHSAGVGRFGDFLELTREDLEFTLKTNVEASFLFLQAAYAQLKKQKTGSASIHPDFKGDLVWITSVAAERPFEQSAIYCMSKFAQRGLIDVMRLYGRKDGIRILEVRPGATFTPMWGKVPDEVIPQMSHPDDVAASILDSLLIHPRSTIETLTLRPLHGDL